MSKYIFEKKRRKKKDYAEEKKLGEKKRFCIKWREKLESKKFKWRTKEIFWQKKKKKKA